MDPPGLEPNLEPIRDVGRLHAQLLYDGLARRRRELRVVGQPGSGRKIGHGLWQRPFVLTTPGVTDSAAEVAPRFGGGESDSLR